MAESGGKPVRKSNGKNSPVIGDNGIKINKGDASKYANVLLDISSWEVVDRNDVKALEQRFLEYINYCANNDLKIGNQMAYLALGISKDDVYDWENRRSMTVEHSDFIKKVKAFCSGNRELLMQDGKVHPITGIFWQKNYDGMKDVQDIQITPNSALGDQMTSEEIAKSIAQDPDGDLDIIDLD